MSPRWWDGFVSSGDPVRGRDKLDDINLQEQGVSNNKISSSSGG
jgi:hypothetical protein